MSYFPLLSNPIKPILKYVAESAGYTLKLFFISHTLSSVTRAHFSLSRRMLLQTRYHISGPGGIRTLVQQLILGHAKISMLNISGISRNIRFKAIFRLSDAFLAPCLVATPSKVLKPVRLPYFRP